MPRNSLVTVMNSPGPAGTNLSRLELAVIDADSDPRIKSK